MSGHSKWSKVKHQKEASDAAKGKIFTKLANAIIIAVREGGGITDLEGNFRLRLAVEKAKNLNMPKENIERAIEKGKGNEGMGRLEKIIYEAFGPGGVGILIETATDNKQRTVAAIKNVLDRGGGSLAGSGAVSYLFKLMGLIRINKKEKNLDEFTEIAINVGANDLDEVGDTIEIYTMSESLHKVKEALTKKGLYVESAELFYHPITLLPINNKETALSVLKLLSSLEELDDIQRVFANIDIPEEYL